MSVAFLGEGSNSLYFPGEEALVRGDGTCVCVFRSLDRPFHKKNGYGVTVAEPTRPRGASIQPADLEASYGALAGCVETEGENISRQRERRTAAWRTYYGNTRWLGARVRAGAWGLRVGCLRECCSVDGCRHVRGGSWCAAGDLAG